MFDNAPADSIGPVDQSNVDKVGQNKADQNKADQDKPVATDDWDKSVAFSNWLNAVAPADPAKPATAADPAKSTAAAEPAKPAADGASANPVATDDAVDWARIRTRFGRSAVSLLLLTAGILGLTYSFKIYLAAAGNSGPTVPAASSAGAKRPHTGPIATVAILTSSGHPLDERSGPSTDSAVRGHLADGAKVGVMCQAFGQKVTGPVTTSPWWEVDSHGLYISDAYIAWSSKRPTVPWCGVNSDRAVTATARVDHTGLSERVGPSVTDRKVGSEPNGAVLTVVCRSWGETVSGVEGRTAAWSKLANGDYVSEAFVHWSPEQPFLPWCGEAPRIVPPASTKAFIKLAVAPAQASMDRYGVPASVTIAQAILESGSGASTLTQIDHAVFGMKCFGDPGPVAVGCRSYGTHECSSNGKCYGTSASFRAYKTEADSFTDHGLMLSTLSRYRPTLAYTYDPN
ncbi:MAG TPA: sporangiospore maturation cell wall hydrolase GsmA, partial [Micromonosporaceae bacterium]